MAIATNQMNQRQNKVLSLQQINNLLLNIVNSIYLDKADAIINVPRIEDKDIVFKFRDGREIYDAKILSNNHLSYVESSVRGDTYLEGSYLIDVIPSLMPSNYVDALLESKVPRNDAKRRRCQRGKPCGDACIEKGDTCDRKLPPQAEKASESVRNAIAARNVALGLGIGALGIIAVSGLTSSSSASASKSTPSAPTKNQPPPTPTTEKSTFPALNPNIRDRPNPSNIEVITSRPATAEEVRQFRPNREVSTNVLQSSGSVIETDPRTRSRAVGANNAVQVEGFESESEAKIRNVLNRIDRVVQLPPLPPVSLRPMADNDPLVSRAEGVYHLSNYVDKNTGELIDRVPNYIALNVSNPDIGARAELTTIHEFAHFLDHAAIGSTKEGFATAPLNTVEGLPGKAIPAFNEFLLAVESTKTTKNTINLYKKAKTKEVREHAQYQLQRGEIFARAFTQYVATNSGSGVLKSQLKTQSQLEKGRYWSDAEFKKIQPAMEKMFKEWGWQ